MATPATPTTVRTYASKVVIHFGDLHTTGDLKPLRHSEKADSFCTLCPGCLAGDALADDSTPVVAGTATKMEQRLICEHGHGPYESNECTSRGKEVDGTLYSLTPDDVAAARSCGSDSKAIEIHFYPADQVEAETRPTGIAYAYIPIAAKDAFFGVLCDLADRMGLAMVGTLILRGKEKLFRVDREDFGISLVEVCFPEEVNKFAPIEHEYSPELMALAEDFVRRTTKDFKPEEHVNGTAARVAAIIAAKESGTEVTAKVTETTDETDETDMIATLKASLAALGQKEEAA